MGISLGLRISRGPGLRFCLGCRISALKFRVFGFGLGLGDLNLKEFRPGLFVGAETTQGLGFRGIQENGKQLISKLGLYVY